MTPSEPGERGHELRRQNSILFSELLRSMAHIDIPAARPNFARQVEGTGLTLLSLALRLNHIIRVSESLRLINTNHMSRTVSLDVDLRNLTALQRRTLAAHESSLSEAGTIDGSDTIQVPTLGDVAAAQDSNRIWVPISRHSREDLAPVVVKDADGLVVPRLTQQAATDAIVAGVTRLFRMQLKAEAHEVRGSGEGLSSSQSPVEDLLRARWLIEKAIAHLIQHGIHGRSRRPHAPRDEDSPIRILARNYLLQMRGSEAKHYAELLRAASREYFLIVMIDAAQSHQFLTYDAPLIPAVRSTSARGRAWRALLPFSTEFTVDYVTQIPRSVGSYHVTIDVPEEIDIRRFILSSDAEHLVVDDLSRQIGAYTRCAARADSQLSSLLIAERREIQAMVGTLGQRRHLDVEGFDYYLRNRDLLDHRAGDRANQNASRPDVRIDDLRRWSGARADRFAEPGEARAVNGELARIGRWIRSAQLGIDVSTDNDPRENGAHAQWRPVSLGFGQPTVEPIEARVFLALADEPPALVESVARMIGALVAVVLGVLLAAAAGTMAALKAEAAAQHQPIPDGVFALESLQIGQADAAVAVLLIVPGILLTRLEIHATHSVLGRLRRFPQLVAYLSVAFTTALALIVAGANTDSAHLQLAFGACTGLLLVLLGLCYLEKLARHIRRQVLVPRTATIPAWLRYEFGGVQPLSGSRRIVHPDVYFDAIRPVPNTTRVASPQYENRVAKRDTAPRDRQLATPEGPARLADLAARAVSRDHTASEISVTHSRADAPDVELPEPDEVIFTRGSGFSFQAEVRSRREHDLRRFKPLAVDQDPSHPLQPDRARWVGRSAIAPVSIRENASEIGFLADFGHLASGSQQQQASLHFLDDCLHLDPLGIVPTLVTTPAAAIDRVGEDDLPRATSPAVRLSFAVPHGHHRQRLEFEAAVVQTALQHGVSLWRASRRPDAGQGAWEPLVAAAPPAVQQDCATQQQPLDVTQIPITFVTRRGDEGVEGLRTLVGVLRRDGARVVALTAAVIGQHALVNLTAEGSRDAKDLRPVTASNMNAAVVELRSRGVLTTDVQWDADAQFSVCFGVEPLPAQFREGDLDEPDAASLWIDWELPPNVISQNELAALFRRGCGRIGPAQIRFWRSRTGSDERVRGRAKLAISPIQSDDINKAEFDVGDRAKAVQSHMLQVLHSRLAPIPPHGIFLHVVWSEPWLAQRRGV